VAIKESQRVKNRLGVKEYLFIEAFFYAASGDLEVTYAEEVACKPSLESLPVSEPKENKKSH